MATHEETLTIHRELDDGTEIALTTLVQFTVSRGHRSANRVIAIDYDGDDGYDAEGKAHALTDAEKETIGMEADDARRALQASFNDADEAAAEDAWDAARDR